MTDCLFCKIARKEIAAEAIREDEKTFAFLDNQPRTAGHTLVVSKNHFPDIVDAGDEEIAAIFSAVRETAALLKRSLKPSGFTIGVNQGRSAGQVVDHLHVHVMPRFDGDGGGSIHSVVFNPPKESLSEIKKLIHAGS